MKGNCINSSGRVVKITRHALCTYWFQQSGLSELLIQEDRIKDVLESVAQKSRQERLLTACPQMG